MLVIREGKRPQSQTTGKAYCHLPRPLLARAWLLNPLPLEVERRNRKNEKGGGTRPGLFPVERSHSHTTPASRKQKEKTADIHT